MNRTIKLQDPAAEKTLSQKRFTHRLNNKSPNISETFKNPPNQPKTHSNSTSRIKKIQISLNNRSLLPETESVGEEGIAQDIRSPIVKRGKSSSQTFHILHPTNIQNPTKKSFQDSLTLLSAENSSLKQQIEFYKEQLKVYRRTISDISKKYESAKSENFELEEKIEKILMEKGKLAEENEKFLTMFKFLEASHGSVGNKEYVQEALEAKILSIDQDRDEKVEKYRKVLSRFIVVLQEFLSSQEWIISLVSSPYPKKELKEAEESLKNSVQRLQAEIVYYQSQLSSEKVVEKSYCTSMSSSVLYSPQCSPTKIMRYTNFPELLSPSQNSLINL